MPVTFSIIVPLFNRNHTISDTLNSVLCQSYPQWELIIVDDGSTDGSEVVVKAYCEKDERIKLFYRERTPKGAPTCRNIGIEKSSGQYVIFLDSDDLLAENALENRLAHFDEHPEYDFLVFPMQVFHDIPGDSRLLWNIKTKEDDLLRFLRNDAVWQTTCPVWKKDSLLRMGGWDEKALDWQDWEFHVRTLLAGLKYKVFSAPVDCYLRRDNSQQNLHHYDRNKARIIARGKLIYNVALLVKEKYPSSKKYLKALARHYFFYAHSAVIRCVFNQAELKLFYQQVKKAHLLSKSQYLVSYYYLQILLYVYQKNYRFKSLVFYSEALLIAPYLRKEMINKLKNELPSS